MKITSGEKIHEFLAGTTYKLLLDHYASRIHTLIVLSYHCV